MPPTDHARQLVDLGCLGEDDLAALLDRMEEGVVLHSASGVVGACNPAAERFLRQSAEALAGRPALLAELAPALEDGTELRVEDEPARVALRTGRPCPPLTVRCRRPDGRTAWVVVSAFPLAGAGGGPAGGALSVLLDITERRSLERQLRGTHRMEALGHLAGGVAHDFNNLLTAIIGYNDILMRMLDPGDPRRREAEQVRKAAERAAELTRQLLAFGRRQALQPQVLDLNAVLADLHRMLERLIGEHLRLDVRAAAGLWPVRADRTQLEQIVMNLALNARDASGTGGELRITTANVVLDQAFEDAHPGARAGPCVRLCVEDDGCGMDAETQAHMFEPFFTTKMPGQGTGLGLATVYGIVKQSDGYIDVTSAPGRGTTICVYLPRCEQEPALLPAMPPGAPVPRATGTVLLAEDEEQVRSLARSVLEQSGYTVLEAGDGASALALAEGHPGVIDVLVTDIVMPRMNGPELARALAERMPGLPVLFISGYADAADFGRAGPSGGSSLLMKPFGREALLEKVRALASASTRP